MSFGAIQQGRLLDSLGFNPFANSGVQSFDNRQQQPGSVEDRLAQLEQFRNRFGNRFGTEQADDALRSNTDFTRDNSRDQLNFEEEQRRNRAGFDVDLLRDQQVFNADLGNAGANANAARQMALDSQRALNSVYTMAGDRLNNASRNTNDAILRAGEIATSMFR